MEKVILNLHGLDINFSKAVIFVDFLVAIITVVFCTPSDYFLVEETNVYPKQLSLAGSLFFNRSPDILKCLETKKADLLTKNGYKLPRRHFPLSNHQFSSEEKKNGDKLLKQKF
ncbi:hypothetical protein TNCT_297881 [Trichonephila clavata]|uniref:Uncharacterized protein n=1 Tax=Trichonephila clavata TaxID=2740835 RepID=A0A8X6LWR1_TRICU|nr:hypothetical protein TNCT_297881 [Trichonephila clavata]